MEEIQNYKCKTNPICNKNKKEIKREIQSMLDNVVIERCKSRYINPIAVVKKSSGELRFCSDARNINKLTIPQYPNECRSHIRKNNRIKYIFENRFET